MIVYPTKKGLMDAILSILNTDTPMSTIEINNAVALMLNLTEEQLTQESSTCSGTEYSYRMRWARTELKQRSLITNPKRGEWILLRNESC